jgi:diguanylate cyclase (GGDEF)-like protein
MTKIRPTTTQPRAPTTVLAANRQILLIDQEDDDTQEIATQLAFFGYNVVVRETADNLGALLADLRPIALLIDLRASAALQNYTAAVALQPAELMPPIIVIAAQTDLRSRLEALHIGGKAFLPKPIDIGLLVEALDHLTGWRIATPYRVLVIDDAPMVATYTARILQMVGMEVLIVQAPMQALAALEAFSPDLVLMDLYMPDCTGRELAAVIRQQPTYVTLPIVFLSAESDRATQLAAISDGGDDFLTKPIQPDHLVAALSSRIERARSLRAYLVRDGLTGLLNHSAIVSQLDSMLARAQREQNCCSVAILDLDHFKQVNDSYGHLVGDRVLRSFARLLQQNLRRSDGIGRYGGEEFVVVFPGTNSTGAFLAVEALREHWSHVPHQSGETTFMVTMSAGIAQYPQHGVGATLLGIADQALYEAKRTGRNRLVLAGER